VTAADEISMVSFLLYASLVEYTESECLGVTSRLASPGPRCKVFAWPSGGRPAIFSDLFRILLESKLSMGTPDIGSSVETKAITFVQQPKQKRGGTIVSSRNYSSSRNIETG
jgi:hypothetical protein